MPISYPIDLPSSSFATVDVARVSAVGVAVSPFTGSQQVYSHQGQWWQGTFSLPGLPRERVNDWVGALTSLNGMMGTFLLGGLVVPGLHSNRNRKPIGLHTGSPVVQGGSQTGNQLDTTGWTAGSSILKRGDMFQVGYRLYMVTKDAVSDGLGQSTLEIWPRLRESPLNNAPLVLDNPKLIARLSSNEWTTSYDTNRLCTISFDWVEAI